MITLTTLFHSLIISYLNSRFPQELKVFFYGNYRVPVLVYNVNPEVVNDMKTEYMYMNDLPYPNDLPEEVNRWMAKCNRCNLCSLSTHLDSISYADADLSPNVHMILKLLPNTNVDLKFSRTTRFLNKLH